MQNPNMQSFGFVRVMKYCLDTINNIDLAVSKLIAFSISNENVKKVLSKINRGEIFLVALIPFFITKWDGFACVIHFLYAGLSAFFTDRVVLIIKKIISRKRPSAQIHNKEITHFDLKHSFPSAHAANSTVVVFILISLFQYPFGLIAFPVFAGIGRLISLHHFITDVIGGWMIGLGFGYIYVKLFEYLLQ